MQQLLEYITNNPQQVMFQAVLSVSVVILIALAATIWINQYRYRKHHGFGRKHFELKEFDNAIEELRIAQKLAKKPVSGKKRDVEGTSFLLAEVSIAAARWDEAIEALTECIAISPEKTEYHVSLVESYLRAREYGRARDTLEKALRLVSPGKVDELGKDRIHALPRNRKEADMEQELATLARAVAVSRSDRLDRLEILKPGFEGREFILANLMEGEEDTINLARFYIRQYILEKNGSVENSESGEPVQERPEEQEEIPEDAEPAEAEDISTEEIEKAAAPEEEQEKAPAQPACPKESCLMRAREALERIEMEPESPAFHTLSAFLSVEEGDPRAAEEDYEKAISLDPEYADAYYNLALLCVDEFDDTERAIGYFRSAIESNPAFAGAHHNLALLLLGSGEDVREEVKHHLGEAMKIDPRFQEVYQNLALLLARKDFKEFLLG